MAHPKHKISKSRRDKRRANTKLTRPVFMLCPQCHEPKLPHRACLACGVYKGREVITTREK